MRFLWCKSSLKYVFSWGSALDFTGVALTAPLDRVRLVKMGEVSPGLATFRGLTIAEKKASCLSVSLINKKFTVRYGSYAVCVFMISDARHFAGIAYGLNTKHTCSTMSYIFISCPIFSGLCPIKICQCSGMTGLGIWISCIFG